MMIINIKNQKSNFQVLAICLRIQIIALFVFFFFLYLLFAISQNGIWQFLQVFPYIIHDIGLWGLRSNLYCINSGLLFASRHPVLSVEFNYYKHSTAYCVYSSKGLLMIKVGFRLVFSQIAKEMDLDLKLIFSRVEPIFF